MAVQTAIRGNGSGRRGGLDDLERERPPQAQDQRHARLEQGEREDDRRGACGGGTDQRPGHARASVRKRPGAGEPGGVPPGGLDAIARRRPSRSPPGRRPPARSPRSRAATAGQPRQDSRLRPPATATLSDGRPGPGLGRPPDARGTRGPGRPEGRRASRHTAARSTAPTAAGTSREIAQPIQRRRSARPRSRRSRRSGCSAHRSRRTGRRPAGRSGTARTRSSPSGPRSTRTASTSARAGSTVSKPTTPRVAARSHRYPIIPTRNPASTRDRRPDPHGSATSYQMRRPVRERSP